MSQTETIRAIIAGHTGQGAGAALFVNAIRTRRGADASRAQVDDAVGFCRDIIAAVPVLIDRVREAADARGVSRLCEPVLAHAEAYFVSPVDAMPEGLLGELGLLDDAYLALSVVRLLQTDEQPLIQIPLDQPLAFLEQILGDDVLASLQEEKGKAVQAMLEVVQQLAAETEARRRREAEEEARRRSQRPTTRPTPPPATSPRRRHCGACSGQGTITCLSCGGHGSHAVSSTRVDWQGNTEYVTEHVACGCAAGRNTCGSCGGAGYDVVVG